MKNSIVKSARADTRQTRRRVMAGMAGGVGAGFSLLRWQAADASTPLETTRIRLMFDPKFPIPCYAPQIISEDLLRLEGFDDVQFVPYKEAESETIAFQEGLVDVCVSLASEFVLGIGRGVELTLIGGTHAGCVEVVAGKNVSGLNDLKGKRFAYWVKGAAEHVFLSSVLAYVGLDPERDVTWVELPDPALWPEALRSGEVDVVNAFPPLSYILREDSASHVILSTTLDAPWQHFFCCMYAAATEFVDNYPIATKAALRALLKANHLCEADPAGTAKRLLELGAVDRLEHAVLMLEELPYGSWRDYDPVATVRFWALRLSEAGMLDMTPNEVVERGTNFTMANQLAKELKS